MDGRREDAGAVEEGAMHGEGNALRRNAFSARLEVDVMVCWIFVTIKNVGTWNSRGFHASYIDASL